MLMDRTGGRIISQKFFVPPFDVIICTHGHLDHAMGAAQFEKAYMHSAETDVYKKHSDPAMMQKAAENCLLNEVKERKRNNPVYRNMTERFVNAEQRKDFLPLEDVDAFDLGDRTVTWHPLPGHTPGSVFSYCFCGFV